MWVLLDRLTQYRVGWLRRKAEAELLARNPLPMLDVSDWIEAARERVSAIEAVYRPIDQIMAANPVHSDLAAAATISDPGEPVGPQEPTAGVPIRNETAKLTSYDGGGEEISGVSPVSPERGGD